MALKDEWKNTGKELGGAFADLGKNLLRTAKTGVDKVSDWAEKDNDSVDPKAPESNVMNDGSWRNMGKDMGKAFSDLGKSIVHSAGAGVDKVEELVDKDGKDE